jgi:hypothetical protein
VQGAFDRRAWLADPWRPAPEAGGIGRTMAVALAAFAILATRCPSAVVHPEPWAEDATLFLKQQLLYGFVRAAALPAAGYVYLAPRLVAGFAAWLPLPAVPLCYGVVALLVGAISCAWIARDDFRWLVRSDPARCVIALAFAVVPVGAETIGNVTNLQWPLLWLGFLLVWGSLPSTRAGWAAFVAALSVIGLSGPGASFLVPLWAVRALVVRTARATAAATAAIAPVLLTVATLARDRNMQGHVTLAGIGRLLAWRVVSEPFVGDTDPLGFAHAGAIVPALASTAVGLAVAIVCLRGGPRLRAWLVLTVAFVALYVAGTAVGRTMLVEMAASQRTAWGGERYFRIPAHAEVMVLALGFLLAARWWKLLATPALAMLAVTAWAGFGARALPRHQWRRDAAAFERARAARRTCTARIPVNPPGWVLTLRLVDGAVVPDDSNTADVACSALVPTAPSAPSARAKREVAGSSPR